MGIYLLLKELSVLNLSFLMIYSVCVRGLIKICISLSDGLNSSSKNLSKVLGLSNIYVRKIKFI